MDIRHIVGSSSHFPFFLRLSGHIPGLAFLSLLDPHRNSEKQCDSVVTTLLSSLVKSALTGCLGTSWRRVLGRDGNLCSLKDFSASSPQWRRNTLGVQSVTTHIENEYVPSNLTSQILAIKFQCYLIEDTAFKPVNIFAAVILQKLFRMVDVILTKEIILANNLANLPWELLFSFI